MNKNVAIVGSRGAVGKEMREILIQRKFPIGEIRFFGSSNSGENEISFGGKKYPVRQLTFSEKDFKGVDLVLSSPGASVSRKFIPYAVKAGAVVIDNSSAFRMDPQVPLVIPEINVSDLKQHRGIIANPNCSAVVLLMAITPLYRKNRIKRVICATYQSTSGAGAQAMKELEDQTRDWLEGKAISKKAFPHQIAFNLFSHDSPVSRDGANEEETKVIQESKKILHDNTIRFGITCVRVPVFRAHSQAIHLEFEKPMTPEEARKILSRSPGVQVVDDPEKNYFPMPIEASGGDNVLVCRIRKDPSSDTGLALFACGDQLRKGAALNAVQIAEELLKT